MRKLVPIATVVFAALLVHPAATRAEFYANSMANLMKGANLVAIVRVDSTAGGTLSGAVVEAFKGAKVGDSVHYKPWEDSAPAFPIGSSVLVVCDPYLCPRAWGVDRGGYYILAAYEPMDGAVVFPGLVDHAALGALVAGRTPPPLAVQFTVHFQGEAGTAPWEGTFNATDGKGTANPETFSGVPYEAHLTAGMGFPFWPGDYCDPSCDDNVAAIQIDSPPGTVIFGGGPLMRAKDGSFAMDALAIAPLARTSALLNRALGGRYPSSLTLFTGVVHIDPGMKDLTRGDYPIKITLDATGEPHFACTLFKEDTIGAFDLDAADPRIGFRAGADPSWPQLSIGLAGIHPPVPCPGVAALLAASAPTAGATASWPLEWENVDAHDTDTKRLVGRVQVTAVGDPPSR